MLEEQAVWRRRYVVMYRGGRRSGRSRLLEEQRCSNVWRREEELEELAV